MQKEPISPVTEVALFLAKEKIRERVQARCQDVITNTDIPTAKTVQPARNGDRYDRFAIPCFSGHHVVNEDIPQSLVQAYLQVRRAQARDGVTGVEPGMCTNNKCTYCKGGLLRQYYSLLERLVQIDTELNRNP